MPARKQKSRAPSRKAKARPALKAKARAAGGTSAKPQGPPGAGVFIWHELSTSNVPDVKRFYADLFGWTAHDMPMAGGSTYTLFRRGGTDIAGCMPNQGHGKGSPPAWLVYVAVDDVDASSAKARALGATAVVEPTDIPGIGRFSVIRDPHGAVLALFKPAM
jgi:predicted enzyme related to lactoylglutathione lyase